jgi:beta-N-acetylhexosaminidase
MSLRELRRRIGQLAIVGFEGHSVSPELVEICRDFDLGGVIYFARNVAEPEQVRELSREVAALARPGGASSSNSLPLWISVDQEGGRVARLKRPFTEWPPMQTLGRSGGTALTQRFATALADELVAVGINLDYTPVLDIHTNPKNPVIGDRAFSDRAEIVAEHATVMIDTLQSAGVAACGKHFPGHGDTSTDSHLELPLVEHPPDRLDAIEMVPFRAAVAANVAFIMTAHVLVPSLDAERPATLSPVVIDGWLKEKLGYKGVVLSDDLGMKAISASLGLGEAMIQALLAGCDAALLCNEPADAQVGALEEVIRAVESGRIPVKRIDDALARQERIKVEFFGKDRKRRDVPLSRIGCAEHQDISEAMAEWR